MDAMRARLADLERLLEQAGLDPTGASEGSAVRRKSGVLAGPQAGSDNRRRRGSFPDEDDDGEDLEAEQADQETERRASSSNHIVSSRLFSLIRAMLTSDLAQ